MKKAVNPPVDEKRAINVAEAMVNAARDEAEELSLKIMHENKELQGVLRSYYRQGYVKGVLSVIEKEIHDRLADEITPVLRERHNKRLKLNIGEPGTKKARRASK